MTANATDKKEQALAYIARGWSVIPVRPREKRPILPWLEFQDRIAAPQEVDSWFRRWPDANLGIVTGRVSGLVVLDVDLHHGGWQSLARLEIERGALPRTVEAVTGRGGRHYYFAHPGGILHNRVGLEPGIDLRGDGGYIVVPPSEHPNGKRYEWVLARSPEETELAPFPAWLLQMVAGNGTAGGHPLAHWRQLVRAGVDEGERNNTVTSLAGHLLWHGVDSAVVLDLLLCWNVVRCRPPLAEDEVARTVESVMRLRLRESRDRENS